jgi:hypothetical protein
MCVATFAQAATHYVDASAAGSQDGHTWNNPFTKGEVALAAAQSGDEIWVAAGICFPTQESDRTARFAPTASQPRTVRR